MLLLWKGFFVCAVRIEENDFYFRMLIAWWDGGDNKMLNMKKFFLLPVIIFYFKLWCKLFSIIWQLILREFILDTWLQKYLFCIAAMYYKKSVSAYFILSTIFEISILGKPNISSLIYHLYSLSMQLRYLSLEDC